MQSHKTAVGVILTILAAGAVIGTVLFFRLRENGDVYELYQAALHDVQKEVIVTGQVQAVQDADLAFEQSGRVVDIAVEVGDRVTRDDMLVTLDQQELLAERAREYARIEQARSRLRELQAQRASEVAALDEILTGSRDEEIRLAESQVASKEQSLRDAREDLSETIESAAQNLESDHADGLTAAFKAFTVAVGALLDVTDIQYEYYSAVDSQSSALVAAKQQALQTMFDVTNGGRWTVQSISQANGGTKSLLLAAQSSGDQADIVLAMDMVEQSLRDMQQVLSAVVITPEVVSADVSTITTQKTNIDTELSTMVARRQAITTQKQTNSQAITSAENAVSQAERALQEALDSLSLTKAGGREEQIRAQESRINQVDANISSQEAQIRLELANIEAVEARLAKTVLRSPIDGVVTLQDVALGEIVTPGTIIVKVISDIDAEIEAFIPEVDIAYLETDDVARVTFDAYGDDISLTAKVGFVDPAETLKSGVTTYRTMLTFETQDLRIKPGMTANLHIVSYENQGVLAVPIRAVLRDGERKYVRMLGPDDNVVQQTVTTGVIGSDGFVEILSGLEEGEFVIVSQ